MESAVHNGIGLTKIPSLISSKRRRRTISSKLILHRTLTSSILRTKSFSPLPKSPSLRHRILHCVAEATDHHHHNHDQDHHEHDHHPEHNHDHQHHHHNHCCSDGAELSGPQKVFVKFAKAIGWMDLANFLREHLQLCCCAAALFVAAAACPYLLPRPAVKPVQNAFILVAFPLVGVSAALDCLTDIIGGKVNIHVLMALAAFASIFMGNSLEGGLLLAMFNLAHIAEEFFTSRSKVDVKELKENYPDSALVLNVNGDKLPNICNLSYESVPVHNIKVDSYILVGAGEAVPVDCEVFQGSATITTEHLTGEVNPLEAKVGDRVPGGARNLDGRIIVKAKKTWKESTLSRIVQLTEEAQMNKPKLQRWLDEFGEHYSKVVVALSVGIALLGPILFKWPFFSTSACRGSIYRALGLMVAASPCALAVAPLAYAIAISSCARKGILLKGAQVLDALSACHTIAFDKTGTLTTGGLMFKAIEPIYGHLARNKTTNVGSCCVPSCEKEALAVAAAMEKGAVHPIGRALVDHSVGKDLPSVSVERFEYFPGRGLIATLNNIESGTEGGKFLKASLGSIEFITSLCKSKDDSEKIKKAVNASSYGSNFVHAALAVNDKVTLIHLEDRPRPGVSDVIAELRDQARLRVMMLTGDHESSAWRVANSVAITEVYWSLKPEDKLNHVKKISRDMGGGLIMVGEGINDAPALAAATVGIVLAHRASATAIAVADVLLLRDNISGVPFCIAKSRQTSSLVKQNVALALCSIALASLPSVLGFLPLWLTVLLHEGGTLLVCLNSVRALNDPKWSLMQDVHHVLNKLKSKLLLLRHNTSSNSIRAAHL
ncbi:cadmium/zinc-transporting ATPase HMA1 chloroplastic [Tripterygium wilfordii]|uniref:Cadmium/zinc-transporting ATPase HMA1 chloroplastic n=1 Tax=Tripterygium wilfordii TaxID=458696 RepID=A0A7J7E2Q1_TRIWF|nr:probable cadmium/zinc-transporting ATPase HMA1, chloroplastic [Tripterygium wilfordii]KAF5752867.1 cadmium/zinc-transporting ATPase HMA1 chloroplastic [Tripterygium wilfordii]